jgi:serine protease Do
VVLGLLAAAAPARAQLMPESFADLAERVSPAVVNITTTTAVVQENEGPIVPEGSPLEDFFNDFMNRNGEGARPQQSSALGSGFIVSADGFVVTNNHVIEGADEIVVELFEGRELPATVVGVDKKTDIAVLKVESDTALPFVLFGDSDVARVGDWVLAVGNPLGQGFSVSSGIISARNRELSGNYDDFIQTDAAINRGNSGGPLFNMAGEVIGVNTAILSPTGGSIGIGFSMSSAVVEGVVEQLREFGETRRGWLGVRIQNVEADVAEALGLAEARGALVTDVPPGPAAEAGMQSGDVILSFGGQSIQDTRELVRMVGDAEIGVAVPVEVFREGATEVLQVTLGRLEEEGGVLAGAGTSDVPATEMVLGMTLSAITDEIRSQFNIGDDMRGVVITGLDQGSEAEGKGLVPGDVIVEVGQQPVQSPADVAARLEDARGAGRSSILLLVRRDGDGRFVALDPNG